MIHSAFKVVFGLVAAVAAYCGDRLAFAGPTNAVAPVAILTNSPTALSHASRQVPVAGFKRPSAADLKKTLDPMQFEVTQQCGTEPPFQNAYWDNHKAGIYVDVVSGKPLFSSLDKFDSGSGWPSFTRPIDKAEITEKADDSLGTTRTEVRSKTADSHLGHVFDDGPGPSHLRYCINSAALRFVPVEEMEAQGFGSYLGPFIKAGWYKGRTGGSTNAPAAK